VDGLPYARLRDLLEKLCLDLGLSGQEASDTNEADKLALTTADRGFTVRTVACFGQCALVRSSR